MDPFVRKSLVRVLLTALMLVAVVGALPSPAALLSHIPTSLPVSMLPIIWVPTGVGPVTALAFTLTMGPAERFQRGKQVASYLGLIPSEYSSGGRNQRLGHISKQGNPFLRGMLVEAAQSAVQHEPEVRRAYQRFIETLNDVTLWQEFPEHIRSDNSLEFAAKERRRWLASVGTGPLYIEPGSPWENGYCESFRGKLRYECLNGEIFYTLKDAQVAIEKWSVENNAENALGAGLQVASLGGL